MHMKYSNSLYIATYSYTDRLLKADFVVPKE